MIVGVLREETFYFIFEMDIPIEVDDKSDCLLLVTTSFSIQV